jgi:hypothetical protein
MLWQAGEDTFFVHASGYDVDSSDERYLLQQVVPVSKIQRVINWRELGITKEYIKEQSRLHVRVISTGKLPDVNNQVEMDRYFVVELCMPYNPLPDDRDTFVYYNDIGALCGDAGYIRLRDGYVQGRKVVWRS